MVDTMTPGKKMLMHEVMQVLGVKTKHTMRKWEENGKLVPTWEKIAGMRVRVYDSQKVYTLAPKIDKNRAIGRPYFQKAKSASKKVSKKSGHKKT